MAESYLGRWSLSSSLKNQATEHDERTAKDDEKANDYELDESEVENENGSIQKVDCTACHINIMTVCVGVDDHMSKYCKNEDRTR